MSSINVIADGKGSCVQEMGKGLIRLRLKARLVFVVWHTAIIANSDNNP